VLQYLHIAVTAVGTVHIGKVTSFVRDVKYAWLKRRGPPSCQNGTEWCCTLASSFFNLGTRWGRVITVTPWRFYPPRVTRYPMYGRLGEPHGRSGRVRKTLPPPGFDSRTVQPVASAVPNNELMSVNRLRTSGNFLYHQV
jgi:hypothetical protein